MDWYKLIKRNLGYYFKAKTHFLLHSQELYTVYKQVLLRPLPREVKTYVRVYQKRLVKAYPDLQIEPNPSFGAGSRIKAKSKSLAKTIQHTRISWRYARIIYHLLDIAENPIRTLELGTSAGISTMLMALHPKCNHIDSVDAQDLLHRAIKPFVPAHVALHSGLFKDILPNLLAGDSTYGMVFIDGDHRGEAIIKHFDLFYKTKNKLEFLVFDDINWSYDMLLAWRYIVEQCHKYPTIETYRMGIVWFKEQPQRMHLKAMF